jgi:transcriptional regulator with XRE-family HTH domain
VTLQTVVAYIAANVRQLREKRGLTQEALGEAAGLDFRQVQRAESGRQAISLGTLVALANALEASPSVLFQPAELPPIKRGRPRKAPVAAEGAAPAPSKAARKAPDKMGQRAPRKAERKVPGKK